LSTRVSIVIAVLLVLVTGTVRAGTLEEIVQDLQPVPGYVVLPVQDEFLIDLAASHGVTSGDLFSVVAPGEPITHPVTGKLLGTLDGSKGPAAGHPGQERLQPCPSPRPARSHRPRRLHSPL
jgi:hypothetical protein